jgi:hypothetical protein
MTQSTRSTPAVKQWLAAHPRFALRFTPTGSSWLNFVERWFAELARRRLKRGAFANAPELIDAVEELIALNNAHPKPLRPKSIESSSPLRRGRHSTGRPSRLHVAH